MRSKRLCAIPGEALGDLVGEYVLCLSIERIRMPVYQLKIALLSSVSFYLGNESTRRRFDECRSTLVSSEALSASVAGAV